MHRRGLVLIPWLTAGWLAACSSLLPKPPEPVCGEPIDRGAVRVLDMTPYRRDQSRIAAEVSERVGEYRIMTEEPVWIPRLSATGTGDYAGSIATVQNIAAKWGCDLLLLLDTKMDRTGLLTQARNESRVWLVQAGRRVSR